MGKGVIGVEEDFAHSPSFFGSGGNIDSSRVVTLMTNLIVGAPIGGQKGGGIRPYGAIGVGWINQNIRPEWVGNFSENDFGWDIGLGVMGYFADTSDCASTIGTSATSRKPAATSSAFRSATSASIAYRSACCSGSN